MAALQQVQRLLNRQGRFGDGRIQDANTLVLRGLEGGSFWQALQKGIGVSTTRARLQHLFGADFRFEFHRLQEGLSVLVAVPWRTTQPLKAAEGSTGAGPQSAEPDLGRSSSSVAMAILLACLFIRRKTS